MKQIVSAYSQIKDMAWIDPVGIVIVILLAGLRQSDELGKSRAAPADSP